MAKHGMGSDWHHRGQRVLSRVQQLERLLSATPLPLSISRWAEGEGFEPRAVGPVVFKLKALRPSTSTTVHHCPKNRRMAPPFVRLRLTTPVWVGVDVGVVS
jgi:hypothetical protein